MRGHAIPISHLDNGILTISIHVRLIKIIP